MELLTQPTMSIDTQELKVNVTSDLNIFKFLSGNRPPNPQHVKRLTESIKQFGMLCNPILVNEKHEIIDGQHRYLAAREAKCPVYYIIAKGYALEQVHALNLNQKNWTIKAFLDGYVGMGLKDYILLDNFIKKHSWLKLSDAIALCSNVTTGQNYTQGKILRKITNKIDGRKKSFKEGTWTCENMGVAESNAYKLKSIEPFFPEGYNASTFVGTMLMMFKKKQYDHDSFLNRLKAQPNSLVKCATREQYKLMIEDIYNYRRRSKVNLRY